MQASYYDSSDHQNKLNDYARLKQLEEIASFIHKKTKDSLHPALITGDFNVNAENPLGGGESEEYRYMMKWLNNHRDSCSVDHLPVRDLLKEHNNGLHPTTYADVHPENAKLPRETVLTHKADLCTRLCIDYMLFLDTNVNCQSRGIQCKEQSTKVEELFINDHPYVTQMSDHYAVTTTLTVT